MDLRNILKYIKNIIGGFLLSHEKVGGEVKHTQSGICIMDNLIYGAKPKCLRGYEFFSYYKCVILNWRLGRKYIIV